MGLSTREVLQLMTEFPNIKSIRVIPNKELILEVEAWPPQTKVQAQEIPIIQGMPTDDELLYMSSEGLPEKPLE